MTAPSRGERFAAAFFAFCAQIQIARSSHENGDPTWGVFVIGAASFMWLWQAYREWKCGDAQ